MDALSYCVSGSTNSLWKSVSVTIWPQELKDICAAKNIKVLE